MRKLSVDDRKYLWRVYRRRSRDVRSGTEAGAAKMGAQVFMAAQEGYAAAPLRIVFDDAEAYPERVGIVVAAANPPLWFNLHLPRTAEAIIRHALDTVWRPTSTSGALQIQDGPGFLLSLPANVKDAIGWKTPADNFAK